MDGVHGLWKGGAGGDLEVDDRFIFAAQQDFDVVLGVAEGVGSVHRAEDLLRLLELEQAHGLIHRVGAGVEQVSALVLLQRLPVPAAGEAAERERDLNDAAEDSRVDDLQHLLELRRVARLLKGQESTSVLAGGGDYFVELGNAPGQRFFADGVVAGIERLDSALGMELAGEGIDDEVEIASSEQLAVVGVGIAADFAGGALAAIAEQIGDRDYLKFTRGGFQVAAVDVEARTALAQDGDAKGLFSFGRHRAGLR